MCTCYRKRNPNFDVVESEVLFGCENVRNISQRVWWWRWWWGGGDFYAYVTVIYRFHLRILVEDFVHYLLFLENDSNTVTVTGAWID